MTHTYFELKTHFGIVTVTDSGDGGIDYNVNGERVATHDLTDPICLEQMELRARFIVAGLGAGFGIGRMSAA